MGELLAVTCDSCAEPMVPNVSTLDAGGCGWICLNPGCPELAAGELEAEDLVEAGVPQALAGRLARLHALLLELGRLAEGAGALAAHLDDALAAVGALCTVLRRTAAGAQDQLAGVDPELPGLLDPGSSDSILHRARSGCATSTSSGHCQP